MSDIQQDIGDLKATVRFAVEALLAVRGAVEKNNDVAAIFREHVVEELTAIKGQIVTFAEYKTKCEDDHDSVDQRIDGLEEWRSREAGFAAARTVMIATAGSVLGGILASWSTVKEFVRHM